MKVLTLTLALACVQGADALAQQRDFPDLLDSIKPAIVGVGTYLATRRPPAQLMGTGFVIGDGQHVATNDHVVPAGLDDKHRERLVVFVGRGRESDLRDATVVAQDAQHDLAVLKISGTPLPALEFAADDSVREGDDIAFTGFPIGAVLGLYPVTHRGIVSAITPIAIPARDSRELSAAQVITLRNPYNVLQLDATAYPGNSGSPVYLHGSGRVVGVINKVLVKGKKENVLSDPSAITYAIPIRFLRELAQSID